MNMPTVTVAPAGRSWDFYRNVYDRLYRRGYHKDPDYSHAKSIAGALASQFAPRSVLDVGCSLGWVVEYFAKHGVPAMGVDVSETAVTAGRRLGRDLRLASATSLPFADRSVDAIVCTDCLEHMRPEDVDVAVSELSRVAARYLALKINPRADRNRWWKYVAGTPLHLALMPMDEWKSRFAARGFAVVHTGNDPEEFILARQGV